MSSREVIVDRDRLAGCPPRPAAAARPRGGCRAGLGLPSGELSWRGIAADGGREVDGCLPAVARTRPGTSMRLIDAASTRPACGSATLHLAGQDMGLGASARGTARARTLEW